MRVVLLAEGPAELSAATRVSGYPGDPVPGEAWGPGHWLMGRCLARAVSAPVEAINFAIPLNRAREARGSALHNARTLRRLLVWPGRDPPDLFVALMDENGEPGRRARLLEETSGLRIPHVIGVARREFEAWLIADHAAVGSVLGGPVNMSKDPESLVRGGAKELLAGWIASAGRDGAAVRAAIARTCSFEVVAQRCPSFARLLDDLGAVGG